MKFLSVSKDGGAESTVWAHWLFEIKGLCSIVLLRFEDGSRDAYHSHAFNSISWVLRGHLTERVEAPWGLSEVNQYPASLSPVITRRETHHKVVSRGRTWVLSFRGPWARTWTETLPSGETITLTHGRRQVGVAK